ncbi:MAG: polysaccharide deacetylase family protein, partial [Eubacteriales bacterium]|nr:polysaccharide deacetylase family protein [Eubacteriales bacterium]
MKWKRQLKTTFFLMVLIASCVAVAQITANRQQTATTSTNPEQVMQEISDALTRYQEHGSKDVAVLRTEASKSTVQKAELVFDGISDKPSTQKLLDLLAQNDLSASFFLTGQQAADYSDSLALIAEKGYTVGLSYTDATASSSTATAERAVSVFMRSGWAIQSAAGIWPSQVLMLNVASDDYLAAAYACSVNTVTVPTKTVTLSQVATDELASAVVESIARGSILCVRLSDKDVDAATAYSALCAALEDTDLGAHAASLAASGTAVAGSLTRIYTSEAAVAFTFSGMGNDNELQATLSVLREVHAQGTFFVTRDELTQYSDEIKAILEDGNSLGIAIQATRYTSEAALLEELLETQESIRTLYQYTDELAVRPLIGSATGLLEQACGAGGFTLLSAMVNAVRTEDIRNTDATAVMEDLLPEDQGVLQRGEIVHFQMNQYQKSNTMLSNLVKLIAQKRNIYEIKPVMTIANNKKYVYQYPLPDSAILPEVKDRIYPGQLSGDVMTAIASRYIGVSWVATSSFLPGFTRAEIKQLDKKGMVLNGNNMVFLTFDDWGTDRAITEIL